VDLTSSFEEGCEEAEALYVVGVQMGKEDVDPVSAA
jgi:hypothetical protein